MAWVKVLSSVSRNRKFIDAGPAASWLWLCGLVYCQEGLTDGFIPFQALDYLGVKGAQKLKCRLVAARLWEEVPGGWRIHDYLEHNKPAAEVRGLQQERRRIGSEGGRASGLSRRKEDREATGEAPMRSNLVPETKQSAEAPVEAPVEPRSETATATASEPKPAAGAAGPAPRARTAPLVVPSKHFANVARFSALGDVPNQLHAEFVRRVMNAGITESEAEGRVEAFYAAVEKVYAGKVIGEGPLEFWRARFKEQFGGSQPSQSGGVPSAEATRRRLQA